MKATGVSTWEGSWKMGRGELSTGSDTIKNEPFTFSSRFLGTPGGSPEELLATALAGCFNQALANNLGMVGFEAESIETIVDVDLENRPNDFPSIDAIFIRCTGKVPTMTPDRFAYCAERARTHCSIARLLAIEIRMEAKLSDGD